MKLIDYFDEEAQEILKVFLSEEDTRAMIDRANHLRANGYPNFHIPEIPTYEDVVDYLKITEYEDGDSNEVGDLSINVAWDTLEFEWV